MKLVDSRTYENLARSYASECQARTRYEFIEYGARINGYKNIADIIDEIAYQEFNHARMFYTFIQDGDDQQIDNIEIVAGFPFREKWDLCENLRLASMDEAGEANVYAEFASIAKEEGFPEIEKLFLDIMRVETYHKEVFAELHTQIRDGTLYKKSEPTLWVCADCGYMATGLEPWDECPLCKAKRGSIKLVLDAFNLREKIKASQE